MPANLTTRYVEMTITSNWGSGYYTGLSEVQFSMIPEPAALVIMASACCGLFVRKSGTSDLRK